MNDGRKNATIRWIVGLGSLGLALFFAALGGFALREREALWQLQLAKQHESQQLALQSAQLGLQDEAQLLAQSIAADPSVVELVRQAYVAKIHGGADSQALSAARNQLYTRLAIRWRALQDSHPFDLYVHLAPSAEVLLRVHQPEWYGDRPDAQQAILHEALQTRQIKAGLGSKSLAMHAIAPLLIEGLGSDDLLAIGAIEAQVDIHNNLSQLDRELDAGIALRLKRGNVSANAGGELLRGLGDTNNWYLESSSRPQVQNWQALHKLPDPAEGNTLTLLEDQGRTYLLNQIPLPSYISADAIATQPSAMALTWRDISDPYFSHQREQRWLLGKWLLAWLGAETLLVLLLLATRHSSQQLMRQHHLALQDKHRQSEQSRQLLAVIAAAQAAYINAQNQRVAFDALLKRILELTASQFGFIGEVLYDEQGARYLHTYAISYTAGDAASMRFFAEQVPVGIEFRNLDTLFGQVIRSGVPLLDNDPMNAPYGSGLPPGHPRLHAFAGLPIHAQGEMVGMLGLGNCADGYAQALIEQLQPLLATLGQLINALRRDALSQATQHRQWRLEAALRALNEIAALPKLSSQEQLRQALRLGADFYQVPIAIISKIEANDYRVLVQVSPQGLHDGQRFALNDTYCSLTLRSDDVLAIDHMRTGQYASHPCYASFALETYIGIALWVGGQRFGTLSFSASDTRAQPFDEADHEFLRLFARWVGATLERQQQELARQALLERLDEAQQIARLGHWESNSETGEQFCSATLCEIFGYDPQQFSPSVERLKQVVHPDDLALVEASEARVRNGGKYDVTHRILRRDGTVRWVHALARLQADEQGRMTRLVGTVQDITEQAEAQAELKSQRQRLTSIIEGTHVGTWEWNVISGAIVFNRRWSEITGYTLEELAPLDVRTWLKMMHPEDAAMAKALIKRHFRGKLAYYDCQIRVRHKHGHWVWIHDRGYLESRTADGQPLLMYGTHTDISETKHQEEQVRNARAFLQAVLDAATGVSIIATDSDGLISLFNSGAEQLLGYSASELIGRCSPVNLHLAEEIEARGKELSILAGRPVDGFEVFIYNPRNGEQETRQWTYVRKNGEQRRVNLTVNAIRDGNGAITGYLGIAADISELHQATRALQRSESRFRGMVANLPGVVYRCHDDRDWSMVYVSAEIASLTGYPASDFIDNSVRSFASIIHPDDQAITYGSQVQLAKQQSYELTYRLIHADGHSVWVREKGRGEYDSDGKLLWLNGFIWDISERKQFEDEIRLSQELFSNAFNTAPQGMALISPEGRWQEVNDELCRMLGYSRHELLRSSFQTITHSDDLESDLDNLAALLAGRISGYQIEKRFLDKLGRVIWVLQSVSLLRDSAGKPLHFIAQIQDFSERIATERAIREREHYLRTVLDNILDAIITIDKQGRIETFNRAAEQLFGYSHDQVAGRNVSLLMPEPNRSAHDGYLARYLAGGSSTIIGQVRELNALRSNGEVFAMELAVSQISHQGEQRFIAVIRDIDERKRIERMKNEFVSTVSHELRTPLTAIAGSLGLINGGALGEAPAAMGKMLQIAEDNSKRLNLLINDLLDMEKLVAGKMLFDLQPEALLPLVEQAIEQNQPYASEHQVSLLLQPNPAQVRVRVDRQRLAQVLANLLSNAAKFSPPGKPVEISLQTVGERVRVSVHDHGPGVPEAFQSQIFSKFSQADATDTRQKGGTGLGLAISKEIIERMDGHIGFDSIAGQGATFWFELTTLDRE
nr:PAS domain S-box protein [uncultured Pseudomonas sp.]